MTLTTLMVLMLAAPPTQTSPTQTIEVQGHRGARAVLPENTLPAFDHALEVGVEVLELDLGVTKDDRLVVLHDPAIDPVLCLDAKGQRLAAPIPVRTLTLTEVKGFDCGTLKNPRFPKQASRPGTRIPTLEEVFAHVKASKHPAAKTVHFNIETKIVPGKPAETPDPKAFAQRVVDAVRAAGMVERTVLQSFDQRTLIAAAAMEPKMRRAILISENHIDHVAAAKAAQASIVSPNHLWITAPDVERMHAAGLRVAPWTVNTPDGWARMVELKVDSIITDDPKALIAWLRARGARE
jgi:glycerophosphoryl diester phosphodiesterase